MIQIRIRKNPPNKTLKWFSWTFQELFMCVFQDYVCPFSMSFQHFLIEWISNWSDFHTHCPQKLIHQQLVSITLSIPLFPMSSIRCIPAWSDDEIRGVENCNSKFHDFPGSVCTVKTRRLADWLTDQLIEVKDALTVVATHYLAHVAVDSFEDK